MIGIAPVKGLLDHWLFRLGRPIPLPIVLGHRQIFLLPTGSGYAFAAALLVMLVASINYNLSLGYGLVFLLAGAAFVSMHHAFRNLLRLGIAGGRVEPVHAGQPIRFQFVIGNARRFPRHTLRLQGKDSVVPFSVAPEDQVTAELRCATHRRGWISPGRVRIETTYPLGLIRAWTVFVPDLAGLVYPTPEASPPPLPDAGPSPTLGTHLDHGDDDFAGLQAHQLSDSPKHVAWKVVARDGPMLTKRFAGATGGECELDWATLPANLDTEARLSRLTAWILAAQASGRAFGLSLPGTRIPPARGESHVHHCLKQLALFDSNASSST